VERFEPLYEGDGSFLFFGRLSREKGIATLVRAAAQARVPLRIAGTGPQSDELRALAAASGAQVEFLGHLGGQALRDAIRAARAIVLPSEWYENAPMSVLEAYASGKPVLGAAIGGIPELVRPGETGEVFASADVEALTAALAGFAALPAARVAELGRNARRWVEADFTAERYRERLLALYGTLGVRGAERCA
jgi:glycosyltransferase involved in cell wall biosynthesis